MTRPARPDAPRSAAGPWDLSFLRAGSLVTLVVTAVAVPVVGLLSGWAEALGVVLGAAIVTLFFCLSGFAIAWAGKIDDSFTLPAALGAFMVKVLGFFALLQALPADGWPDRVATAWTVIAGALLWSGVQARWVWTRQLYYTTPPAPPSTDVLPHAVEHPVRKVTGG
ncbi:hypothetical protein [Modestobacter sp. Leaf380]|uniref:hypothetical protein n=1 Tax=Modestobacter sp. Leaf380 TaxID=1736356 RepID=UPI0006FD422C|nr:hypothetical protein [Modestobacter sp. Leaf380]KQS73298.1 hypothetical protein ASG41_00985 [Modestobacter sp. Leaf380]